MTHLNASSNARAGVRRQIQSLALALFAFFFLATAATAQRAPGLTREFPPGTLDRLDQLPATRLRGQIEQLPPAAQQRALQWLRSFHFTEHDLASMHSDFEGAIFYADEFDGVAPAETAGPSIEEASVPINPLPAHLIFHSKAGSPNVLYLNFSGEEVSGTAWNTSLGRTLIPATAFSTDSDYATFSDAEQTAIKRIWLRVAEDYAPFDIDVTTERPAIFDSRTAHLVITRNTDANGEANPSSSAGGVAYVNVFGTFNYASYRPAWVYFNNLGNNESYIAEAASHEAGHNLGLSHDGTTSSTYYGGHGSGDISWGPLMGTGYNRNVSQWSKGEYYQADNTQDDLATIAAKVGYRNDDHGNTPGTATSLSLAGGTNIISTTPDNDPDNFNHANKGTLERNSDVDVFSFVTGSGMINVSVKPWIMPAGTRGGNADLLVELYDDAGLLLMTNNPALQTVAQVQTNLPQGRYYLHVRNSGAGNPMSSTPSGYAPYGSIGQFFISGYVVAAPGFVAPPVAELAVTDMTQPGQSSKEFTVAYSDEGAISVSTIDSNDIRVTGPNGYDHPAQLLSVNAATDGSPRTATYAAPAPSGDVWLATDNGTYTIWMQSNQVSDTEGAWVPAGELGVFEVILPVALYYASMSADPGWTLEPDWQYGAPNYVANGPAGGFSGTNIIGYNLSGNYGNRLPMKYATTPIINCSGSSSATLRFRRWLRTRPSDEVVIEASTNGTDWATIWATSGAMSDTSWQEVQYTLPAGMAGSPAVRLRWGLSANPAQNEIGWNIDDVELLGDGTLDTTPPTPLLSVANVTAGGSPTHSCSVTYTDDSAVRISSLDSYDIVVTGPNGFSNLLEFAGADLPMDGTPCNATYSIPAPGGEWDSSNNGVYELVLLENAVEDIFNNSTPQTALGSFTVDIPQSQQSIVVSATSLSVEPGSNAVFTVWLAESPSAPVSVTVLRVSGDTNLFVQGGATNHFTSTNWSTPVPVTIAASTNPDQQSGTATFECEAEGLSPVSITATLNPTVELTVSANEPNWGTVSPSNGTYVAGQAIELTAIGASFYRFCEWAGDISGTSNPIPIVLNTNIAAMAIFEEVFTTNHPTPLWWLADHGYTNDFELASTSIGANGIPLWQSYVAGLNPGDPDSQFRIVGETGTNGVTYVLNWNSATGRVYTLWSSSNPETGFAPVPGASNLPWTAPAFTNTIEPSAPTRFYRIQVQKP